MEYTYEDLEVEQPFTPYKVTIKILTKEDSTKFQENSARQ